MRKRRASFHNLGCKVNAWETDAMEQMLVAAGYEIVPFGEAADVCVINTCSVTNIADRKSRQMLHRAKKQNPDAAVVAVGCYVQAAGELLRKDGAVDILIGNDRRRDLPALLEDWFRETIAGIRDQKDGFKTFTIRPQIPKKLTRFAMASETARGLVSSRWEKTEEGMTLEVSIPVGSTAEVFPPAKDGQTVYFDGVPSEQSSFTLGSGTYIFTMKG